MPQKPNVVAGSSGPLVPLKTKELNAYLRLDTWTLTEALFILNGNRPPGFESTSELISHFMDAYDLAVNSIQSGNLCREIKVAGERRFIESPTRWLSWAERKNLYVAEAVRAKMMLAESVDEKTDAPAQGAPGLVAKSSLNEDRPSDDLDRELANITASPEATDHTHSGMPGRPTPKHLYRQEMRRRAAAGLLQDSVVQESRDLRDWMEGEHPTLNPSTAKVIENAIRDEHRKLLAERNAQRSSKGK